MTTGRQSLLFNGKYNIGEKEGKREREREGGRERERERKREREREEKEGRESEGRSEMRAS